MISDIFNLILINPILNILVFLYNLSGNLGIAIILLTLIIKTVLLPIMQPALKSMKKQRTLKPELDAIKDKYPNDKKKQAEAQMELFKKHGINPASGCLTQVVMIIVLIALFNVISKFSSYTDITEINSHLYFESLKFSADYQLAKTFLYLDLTKPDPYFIVAILSGVLQFISSKMMMPAVEKAEKQAEKTKTKTDDMAYMMQQQSLYMMPIMNVFIGTYLASGIMIYIVTGAAFTIVQNYFAFGLGGLKPFIKKLKFGKTTSND